MGMFDGWRNRRRRTQFAVEVKGMASLVNAPTVIFASADEVGGFPKILPIVTGPDLPGLAINRQPPGIAQPISPKLWARVRHLHEWIVPGYCVRPWRSFLLLAR